MGYEALKRRLAHSVTVWILHGLTTCAVLLCLCSCDLLINSFSKNVDCKWNKAAAVHSILRITSTYKDAERV